MTEFYADFLTSRQIFHKLTRDKLRGILNTQYLRLRQGRQRHDFNPLPENYHESIAFDHIDDDDLVDIVRPLILNNRSYHENVFLVRKSSTRCLPSNIIGNCDYIFLFSTAEENIKKLYDHYAGLFKTYDQFYRVFKDVTSRPYHCLVIHLSKRGPLEDRIFYYKSRSLTDLEATWSKNAKIQINLDSIDRDPIETNAVNAVSQS